ncbi:MAG TPA: glycosyltransferase family 39 protein [Planctomycetota bacterium]|nr:glycosyltransferase family 39 protein [Planctomycetota bacterium]
MAALFVLAVGLRVTNALAMEASPFFHAPTMDALFHVEWARAVAAGEEFLPGPFFRAPLYPWFLGGLFRLFGDGLLLPRIIQSLVGGVTALLTYAVARRAFGRREALIAGLGAAVYWVLIYFDGELLLPTLIVPLDLAAILLTLRLGDKTTPRRLLAAGLLWGLSASARPNVLLFMPFVAAWLYWRGRKRPSQPDDPGRKETRPLGAVALLALGTLIPILPLTAFNANRGDTVLISSQAGVNFWIGNNPDSDGSTAIVPGTRPDWWGGYHDSIRLAEEAAGGELRPSEVSAHYTRRALEHITAQPAAAARHLLWKLKLFWTDWELGNNQEVRFFHDRFGGPSRHIPLDFTAIAPLGLLGLVLCLRRREHLFPLWGFIPIYTLTVVIFFVCSRFRVPILPPLMILAAHGLVWSFDSLRAGRWSKLLPALALVAYIASITARIPPEFIPSEASGHWQLGQVAAAADRHDEAATEFAAAVAAHPRHFHANRELALALLAAGRTREALAAFDAATRLAGGQAPELVLPLFRDHANLLLGEGRRAAARASVEHLLRLMPNDPRAADLARQVQTLAR